ncbi:hypothetical protein BC937DRAFT_86313 [Endogone sp. FLAS-F59071]|nr:hypothetical protein BC937DRAFT_86313 [Endogone sp. FLAS-F59071]|eukprot:RUS20125.1 hypothetical protein BC937DRAFT_86313 [Endogone sp. FLAS-F59071]
MESSVHTLQFGQTNPLMFSTTPTTGILTLRQKSISLRTSCSATSCGVVITMAPSMPEFLRKVVMLRCSSEVPGGVSTRR